MYLFPGFFLQVSDFFLQNSSQSCCKLQIRHKDKWIITDNENTLGKRIGKDKESKKMSSWKVVNNKTSQDNNVSKCDTEESNVSVRSPLRDRSKIKLPAWRVDDDPKSKILKICIPRCNIKSPISLKVSLKEENKKAHKNEEDNDSSITESPLRDKAKIKLSVLQQDTDSNRKCIKSPRLRTRIATELENKISNKCKEDVTPDRSKYDIRRPLRDRSKIKLPSWRQEEDDHELTPRKNSTYVSCAGSPRVSKRLSRRLEENSAQSNSNSVLLTPKREHSNLKHNRLFCKKKRLSQKYMDSDSDSSENSEEESFVKFKNNEEIPVRQEINHTPKSSRSCNEKTINITTPVSKKVCRFLSTLCQI